MDQIGRYKVLGEIGRGGFGVVYRAHDPVMRRDVAVKVLTAVSDPTLLARFRSEAGATGNLWHKNIITVYDYGECDGQPFLVMELLEGRTLQEAIRGGPPLSLFEKVSVLFQVAEGLRFAHEQGVVHRDVKPSNVMLLHDGCAKILDFGIARYLDSARSRHTTPGFILGTIEYMSPDQLQGVDADPLTDIFSFGVTAYELLSGHQPFRADTISRIMYLVATADPAPLCQLVPGIAEYSARRLSQGPFQALPERAGNAARPGADRNCPAQGAGGGPGRGGRPADRNRGPRQWAIVPEPGAGARSRLRKGAGAAPGDSKTARTPGTAAPG
jgi:serine/threonine-protein kinase